MRIFSPSKFVTLLVMSCLMAAGQARELEGRWRMRVMDLDHHIRVDAIVRFTKQTAQSCIGGHWKGIEVETSTANDEAFFPLAGPLAYDLEGGALTLGRTVDCDSYLFLDAKLLGASINTQGTYHAAGWGTGNKLGYFSLEQVP